MDKTHKCVRCFRKVAGDEFDAVKETCHECIASPPPSDPFEAKRQETLTKIFIVVLCLIALLAFVYPEVRVVLPGIVLVVLLLVARVISEMGGRGAI